MSHFTVMVQIPKWVMQNGSDIFEYVEEVLAPFDENLQVEPYIRDSKETVLAEWERVKEKYPEKNYDQMTIEEFAKEWYLMSLDEEGNLLSTHNMNSKWDWWEIGGRWKNMLRLKTGEQVDFAPVGEIDFDGILEDNRNHKALAWDEAHKDGPPAPTKLYMYGIEVGTREEHIESATGLMTHAVITKDGEWFEMGEMGWFGFHTASHDDEVDWIETFHENYIASLDPEDGVVIVDCHI